MCKIIGARRESEWQSYALKQLVFYSKLKIVLLGLSNAQMVIGILQIEPHQLVVAS